MGKHLRILLLAACLFGLALLPAAAGRPILGPAPQRPPAPTHLALSAAAGAAHHIFLPSAQGRPAAWLNIQSRQAVQDFYDAEYLASAGVGVGWTGNRAACNPGTTAQAFRDAILRRINYFRTMAGVPTLAGLNPEYNRKAQAAALMMSVNKKLSHTPDPGWRCYSTDGAQAAGSSNLSLGVYGWDAITGYIEDPGDGNYAVGHRRWILYPQTREMGTGDVPAGEGYWPANALWVFDSHMWEARPATRDGFVAWPPPGYVPASLVFPRWSFAYDDADFRNATVTVTRGGASLPLTVAPVEIGYGENTLVWQLQAPAGGSWAVSGADTVYTVTIRQVIVGGQSRNFTYNVTAFEPGP